jgi:heme-degrading monooxygenase HmoA
MAEKARFATAHWLRFPEITTPDQLDLSGEPESALSWRIGPCGRAGPGVLRLPSNLWCAVGLYRERAEAEAAVNAKAEFMPFLDQVEESWHQVLLPVRHRGECNYLDAENPGELFEVAESDPGGVVMVFTTAGFVMGPNLDMARVVDFRRHVDIVDDFMTEAEGCLANRACKPYRTAEDGLTFSVWRDDEAMLNAAYRAGSHKEQMERHKATGMFDRSSFTRFRILRSEGSWGGCDPLKR